MMPLDVPYWTLAALNFAALSVLAAFLLRLDPRTLSTRLFALLLFLRGLVGLTATLADNAPASVAVAALPADAYLSTLLSGALVLFALVYPTRVKPERAPELLGLATGAIVLSLLTLVLPGLLGDFQVDTQGRLIVTRAGPLLFERTLYILAIGFSSLVLAWRHASLSGPLRRTTLLLGIAFATFPLYVATATLRLSPDPLDPYGGIVSLWLIRVAGVLSVIALLWMVSADVSKRYARPAVGSILVTIATVATGLVALNWGGATTSAGTLSFVLRGLWRFPLPVLATYALLRHQLLGTDVKLKLTLSRGTVAAIFLAVFLIVSQLIQNIANETLGYISGAIAAGLLLFALVPLQRAADRFISATLPNTRDPRREVGEARVAAYEQTLALLLADGRLTPQKERALAALAEELGIGPVQSLALREQALAKAIGHSTTPHEANR